MKPNRARLCGAHGASVGLVLAASLASVAVAPSPAIASSKAHQHGVATLDVALDGNQVTIDIDSPLDNLLGFERAPRSAAERQRVDAMANKLKAADGLFVFDGAAGCVLKATALVAPTIGLSEVAGTATSGAASVGSTGSSKNATATSKAAAAEPADHGDLNATWNYDCKVPAELRQIQVGLFKAFSGFMRLEVQIAGPRGQARRSLTPASPSIVLPR